MSKRTSKPGDMNELAFDIVQRATGQKKPEPLLPAKSPAAVALGKLGGRKGGKARAAKLSARRRSEIARKARHERWKGASQWSCLNTLARCSNSGSAEQGSRDEPLSRERRAQIVLMLVEGNSIPSIVCMTGAAKNTVAKVLVDLGCTASELCDALLVSLPCKRIQSDELWSFVYVKDKNIPSDLRDEPGIGSVWTWIALCADTKRAVAWYLGGRNAEYARASSEGRPVRLARTPLSDPRAVPSIPIRKHLQPFQRPLAA